MPDLGEHALVNLAGDIAFLMKKEFDGKIVKDEGFLSVAGDLATLTASSGKDMFLARAKCVIFANALQNSTPIAATVELKVNGIVIETFKLSWENTSPGIGVLNQVYEFANIGHKVLATQIIKLEFSNVSSFTDAEGTIECVEEDTGVDPTA